MRGGTDHAGRDGPCGAGRACAGARGEELFGLGIPVANWIVNAWNSAALDVLDYQWDIAVPFWREIDRFAAEHGVKVALGLHHASGFYSAVSSSKLGHRSERGMVVYGSAGSYASRMRDVQFDQIMAGERPASSESWGVEEPERWGILATAAGSRRIPSAAGDYTEFYRGFHAAVSGAGPLPVTLDQTLHTIAVLDAARESDARGRSIVLPERHAFGR